MQLLKNIFDDCDLIVERFEQVQGGDINKAYGLSTSTGKYFLKVNDKNEYPLLFERETKGLDKLRQHCTLIVPEVIKHGSCDAQQYLLLEWLEKGVPKKDMWEKFGQGLALMHKQPQEYYGLDQDNYIGSLRQINDQHSEWHLFYTECRIMSLVKSLFYSKIFSSKDLNTAETFCFKLKNIFPPEPAALLHGDLWAGNYLISASGYAAIYDPAVYFGHREMDIGMTKLFGRFDRRFYEAYNETYPLEEGWEKRLPITQLYPLLVHAVLFGGHYVSDVRHIFSTYHL